MLLLFLERKINDYIGSSAASEIKYAKALGKEILYYTDFIKDKKIEFAEMYMDERLIRIRESERKSHTEVYMNEELYNSNSWLQKPIKTVRELSLLFDE